MADPIWAPTSRKKRMKLLLTVLAAVLLQGCAAIESQHYLKLAETDPDCSYQGKPAVYNMPLKCGPKSYGAGHHVSIVKTGPRSYVISK